MGIGDKRFPIGRAVEGDEEPEVEGHLPRASAVPSAEQDERADEPEVEGHGSELGAAERESRPLELPKAS